MKHRSKSHDVGRRRFFALSTGGLAVAALPLVAAGCSRKHVDEQAPSPTPLPANPTLVRVASVPTAVEGDVLPRVAAAFELESSLRVAIVATSDPYGQARAGNADLVVSHYGHRDAETFVLEGHGEWPRTVFSNQMALLGPKSDPARIRGLDDAVQAFAQIAKSKSPFVVNDIEGVRYLIEILWNAAGKPDRAGWFLDDAKQRKDDAVTLASERGAYILWGLTPFLRHEHEKPGGLEPLVLGDPLLQRMLVSIVVKPTAHGNNVAGASQLQAYLLSPATQAMIRGVRYPGANAVSWVPAGRHNRTAILPKG
jgi:tungstate transport system substrate-binding protein